MRRRIQRIEELKDREKRLEARIDILKPLLQKTASIAGGGGGNHAVNSQEMWLTDLADLQTELEKCREDLKQEQMILGRELADLEPVQMKVLYARYIREISIPQIARELYFSERYIRKVLKMTLDTPFSGKYPLVTTKSGKGMGRTGRLET